MGPSRGQPHTGMALEEGAVQPYPVAGTELLTEKRGFQKKQGEMRVLSWVVHPSHDCPTTIPKRTTPQPSRAPPLAAQS